jgi:aminoglycoside phosphotransferase (APT) family kinase protein
VCHGDLHLRHLLVSECGGLAGVIDWIDVCRADAAIDLMLYWGYLTPAGRDAFHEQYGPVADARLSRARVLTVSIWGALAEYARAIGADSLGREAVAGLDRAVADVN